ncbi:hypothetical protein NDU88_005914 [Pleurodeles waltl]|uniref:Uncharacterized protein n=1 Tax=Pleurodeles waltl TaxID=8319 RepID=A0AAV7N5P6_PLEWA|nr:hypothetical protein NDU88_005914 [Pleurodeles waltl]
MTPHILLVAAEPAERWQGRAQNRGSCPKRLTRAGPERRSRRPAPSRDHAVKHPSASALKTWGGRSRAGYGSRSSREAVSAGFCKKDVLIRYGGENHLSPIAEPAERRRQRAQT